MLLSTSMGNMKAENFSIYLWVWDCTVHMSITKQHWDRVMVILLYWALTDDVITTIFKIWLYQVSVKMLWIQIEWAAEREKSFENFSTMLNVYGCIHLLYCSDR